MNAAPSGAMVLHSQQNGNYGGFAQGIQGPPPLQMTTGFGAGAQMGMGYSGYQAPPPYGYQQQMQQPTVQQPQHQQYQQQMQYGYGQSQYAPNNPPSWSVEIPAIFVSLISIISSFIVSAVVLD